MALTLSTVSITFAVEVLNTITKIAGLPLNNAGSMNIFNTVDDISNILNAHNPMSCRRPGC